MITQRVPNKITNVTVDRVFHKVSHSKSYRVPLKSNSKITHRVPHKVV